MSFFYFWNTFFFPDLLIIVNYKEDDLSEKIIFDKIYSIGIVKAYYSPY